MINVKGLCKQIKADKRGIVWSLKNGKHLITNRQWLVEFDQLPKDIEKLLFSILGEFPQEGEHIRYEVFSGAILRDEAIKYSEIIDTANKGKVTYKTDLMHDGNPRTRIFREGDNLIYVNENFLLAVEDYKGEILNNSTMGPVYFKDANYIALPVRMTKNLDLELLELFTKAN